MSSVVIVSKFKAVDKYTSVVKKMEATTGSFAKKTSAGFNQLHRNLNKVNSQLSSTALKIAALGLAAIAVKSQISLDKSLKSLSAITGVTGKEFDKFKIEIEKSAKASKIFKGDMADAMAIVGSAKSELLGNAEALAKVTNATIILKKASGDDLATAADNLTGVMNQFNITANESERVINVLSAGSIVGAANISLVNESMKNFGAVANSSNISLEKSVAIIEVLSKKNIKGAEAGTKARGAVLKLKQANLGYGSGVFDISDALDEVNKKMASFSSAAKKDAYIQKVFGAENVTAGQILLDNTKLLDEYTKAITGTDSAFTQAKINTSSFSNLIDEMVASFKNAITTTDDNNKSLAVAKKALKYVANNMSKILAVIFPLIAALVAFKTVMFAVNAVMAANPVGAIVVGVIALIALFSYLSEATQEWGGTWEYVSKNIGLTFDILGNGIKLGWLNTQNFLLKGIELIQKGWYKLKSLWDSEGANAGLAAIQKESKYREAMIEGQRRKLNNLNQQQAAMSPIDAYNRRSLEQVKNDLNNQLGMTPAITPAINTQATSIQQNSNDLSGNITIDNKTGDKAVSSHFPSGIGVKLNNTQGSF